MRAIDAIGVHHGVQVVFIVPPVYETDRHDSVVNRIFDRALAPATDVIVIDHRSMRNDPSLFEGGMHASGRYYRILAEELRSHGLLK